MSLGGTGVLNPPLLELQLPDPFPSMLLDYYNQHGEEWAGDLLDYLSGTTVEPGQQLQFPSGSAFSGFNIRRRPSPELRIAQDILQHDVQLYPYAAQLENDPWQYVQGNIGAGVLGALSPNSTPNPDERWASFGLGPSWGRNTWGDYNQPLPTTPEQVTPEFLDWYMQSPAVQNGEESIWSSAFSNAANEGFQEGLLRERLDPYNLPADKSQEIVDYFNNADWGRSGRQGGYQYTSENDPLFPFYENYYGPENFERASNNSQRVNLWEGDPGLSQVRRLGADVVGSNALGQYLTSAGYPVSDQATTPSGTSTNLSTQGGTTVSSGNNTSNSTNTGQDLQPLGTFSPWLQRAAGGYYHQNDKGDTIWTSQTPDQWATMFGNNGIFGNEEMAKVEELFNALPLSDQEQAARDLTSSDQTVRNAALAKYPELRKALEGFRTNVIPGLEELTRSGFATQAPELFDPALMGQVQNFATGGNRKPLEDAATTYMKRMVAPQLGAQYAGGLGSFGTDIAGELLNQGRLFSADIANTVNSNQQYGMGMWGDMTSTQGLLESQLAEAAAARKAQGLPLLMNAYQIPQSYLTGAAKDLADIGGNFRANEEQMREGNRIMELFNQMSRGASLNNSAGYIAQGETPSNTTSLLNGLAGQSANFLGGNLAGLGTNFVGSLLNSSLFRGPGGDNSGSFGYAGDALGALAGLIGQGATSVWGSLGGLFGGGGGDPYGSNNYGGSDDYGYFGRIG